MRARYRGDIPDPFSVLDAWLSRQLTGRGKGTCPRGYQDIAAAQFAAELLRDEIKNAEALERLTQWCVLALTDPAGRTAVQGWPSFQLPQKVDHARLVPLEAVEDDALQRLPG